MASFFEKLKGTNAKIAMVIAFFVGYQELTPMLKDFLGFSDDIEAVVGNCNSRTDSLVSIINKRYTTDSLDRAVSYQKFAVGFRADGSGLMSYRSRKKAICSVRVNHITGDIEFYNEEKERWSLPFIEDLYE